ncbi:MAG: hypothetical protein AB8H86_02055 [Polyangiales bacterium]
MKCPACNAEVPAKEIRRERSVARCPRCQVSIDLAEGDEVVALGFREPEIDGLVVEIDEEPKKSDTYRDAIASGGRFYARTRWRHRGLIFLTIFALFWNSFLVVWYSLVGGMGAPIFFVLFPLIHVGVGVGVLWQVLSGWLNHTHIRVEDRRLEVVHKPIPTLFDKMKPALLDEVDMFMVEETLSNQNQGHKSTSGWRIDARLKSGATVPVVTRLRNEAAAHFIARRLEAQL